MIETKRFLLRELLESDATGMFALDSDPEVHRYLGNNPQTDINQARKVISIIRKQYTDFGIGRWAVIDRLTQEFVGWAGLKYEQNGRENYKYYDLGYRLRRKYWGKGIATEVGQTWVKYGFEKLGLEEICAAAHVENLASNKVLIKCGLNFIETFEYEDITCSWYSITPH
jgi:[ribosomal protein S5]-alanine N-acetyltransferase